MTRRVMVGAVLGPAFAGQVLAQGPGGPGPGGPGGGGLGLLRMPEVRQELKPTQAQVTRL